MLNFKSIAEMIQAANNENIRISELVLTEQATFMEISKEKVFSRMEKTLEVMRHSAEEGLKKDLRSISGLTGGDGYKMLEYSTAGNTIGGDFCAKATALAIGIQEYNASMGKIVAAPTAGSCGILPAGVLTMMDHKQVSVHDAVMSLITAGAIGLVIANNASISGAQGGCQAECGSAAAMAAAALTEMAGGSNDMIAQAVAIAIQNQMGLICDPVAGLVEVPCILRNGAGISIAINSADMALAGIQCIIPVDEVIVAMGEVGAMLPSSLRETSKGGLATTPTGLEINEKLFGQ